MSKLFPLCKVTSAVGSQVRWLPRWSHRTPAKVIAAEDYDKVQDGQVRDKNKSQEKYTKENSTEDVQFQTKINWRQPVSKTHKIEDQETGNRVSKQKTKVDRFIKPLTISKIKRAPLESPQKTVDMLETIIDNEGNFIYSKMGNNDTRISSILVDVKSKKEKEKKDLLLLEGKRLITDALQAGCKLEYILFSRKHDLEDLKPFLPKLGAKLYKMPYKEIQMWSDLSTSPGLMGLFKIPDTETFKASQTLPLTVICDNVREPSNLGSILRTCSGVGCEEVLLTKGCVNVWETKVLRSGMGAHFKLRIKGKLDWNDVRQKINPTSTIYVADNNVVSACSADSTAESSYNLGNLLQAIPVLPYYGIDFSRDRHVVLIIGGETEGISEESYKLALDYKGIRLNVPLSNNVDSLNTGTALGIIAFEIKRQLSNLLEKRKESLN